MGTPDTDLLDRRRLSSVTAQDLARQGSAKWNRVPGALGASVAEMDLPPDRRIVDTLVASARRGQFGYFPPALADRLAEACAWFQRTHYGWQVDAHRVRAVGDVMVALETTIEWFTPRGSPIVVLTPAYMPFLTAPARIGRQVVQVAMRETTHTWEMDLAAIDAALRDGAGLVVLCNPHNPIGKVYQEAELRALSEVVERHGARVFADEIHAPLVHPGARHRCYASLDEATARHTITATSASKAWNMPGLKCAQVVLGSQDAHVWDAIRHSSSRGASNPGAEATITAYYEGGPWLAEVLRYLETNRQVLADLVARHLPRARLNQPEATYLGWLDCRGLRLGPRPGAYFLDHASVSVTEGAMCGVAGEGRIRLNFATPTHILEQIVTAMGRSLPSATPPADAYERESENTP